MSALKILSDINCTVRCDFKEVGNIQAGELYKLQLKKGCYILEFLVEDIVICSMDYTIETNDEEPLLRLNIKEQAGKKIREQKFIRNKSTNVNIYLDDDRYILDCEANNPIVIPKGYDLYYKSIDGQYIEDEAGYLPFRITIVEERIENGETNKSEKTLYGSLNKLGEIIIKPIYNEPVIFYNSEIASTTRNKCLIRVNHYGEEIALSYLNTDCFDIIAPLDKKDNLFIAKSKEDKSCFGVVRYDKKIIVSLSNKTIYKNTGDYIWALKGDTLSIYNNEGKWVKSIRYVDLGEIELPYRIKHQDYVFVHKDAVAVRASGFWGLYDFDGNTIVPHIYKLIDLYYGCDETGLRMGPHNSYGSSPLMFVYKRERGYGIINVNVFDTEYGIKDKSCIMEVIPCKYDAVFSNNGKQIELLKENFFQWDEQCDDGSSVEHGIGDNIFFVKHQENLLECDYFYIEMLSFGKKDKEEHFVCKEFNQYQYIDEDGNPHLRGKNRDKSSIDKEELINTSRHALIYSEDGISIIGCDETFEGDLIVPEGIRYIAEHAFVNCKLTSVYIPNSVIGIGTGAFRCCRSLTSVTIGNSVKSIGDYVFEGCNRLTSVIIPNSVTKIGIGAFLVNQNIPDFLKGKGYNFFGNGGLTNPLYNATLFACMPTLYSKSSYNIPDGIKEICDGAFTGCSGLVSVKIPNSVTKIGDRAFSGCSGLTSIEIPDSVKAIGHGAFDECFRLTSVTIPNSVTSIGEMAFHGCSGLTSPVHNAMLFAYMPTSYRGSYNIPDGIKEICGGAFWCCHDLTSVTIPNSVTSIGNDAFSGCHSLISITIPNSVKSIGDGAFSGCTLNTVTIPNSVTSIKNSTFCDCSSLTTVTIPDSVKSIGDSAFDECFRLTFLTIPNSVTTIGVCAFKNCSGLTSIKIPNSVTSIGDGAFRECSGLTSVTISHSVTTIGVCAFKNCSGLTSITIPNSVTSIGDGAFSGCHRMTSPIYNATLFVYMPPKYSGIYDIPNGIKEICGYAFSDCSYLTSVTIPDSVKSIGCGAFRGCNEFISITIPNSVTSIGAYAFEDCSGLTSVMIPNSVTNIGACAFENCSDLTSITIPNSVNSIGGWAFYKCHNLKRIIIPNGTRGKFEKMLPNLKDKLVEQEQMAKKGTKDRIVFFDTETTGVPLNYKAPSSDTNNWPRLVQLAWILTDEEGNRIHTGNLIVKPEVFIIPTDATRVHGITTQRAKEEGVPLAEVIEQFNADLDVANYIVGHNIDFDKKIVGAEMIRLGMKDIMDSKKSYCTMQSSINFCRIPGKYGYKYPKLQELYKKLFGTEFENAHNAMSDIEATEKCFWELRKRKLI